MSDKKAYYLFNIVSIVFLVFGLLQSLVAVTSIVGTVTGMMAAASAEALGRDSGGFPFIYGFGGALYFGLMGALYFAASIGLYKGKKWTALVISIIGVIGLIDALLSLNSFQPKYYEFFWVSLYFLLAFAVFRKPKMFKN